MTQKRTDVQKIAELNAIFLTLNEQGQESALAILKSLEFAQSVKSREENGPQNGPCQRDSSEE